MAGEGARRYPKLFSIQILNTLYLVANFSFRRNLRHPGEVGWPQGPPRGSEAILELSRGLSGAFYEKVRMAQDPQLSLGRTFNNLARSEPKWEFRRLHLRSDELRADDQDY